MKTDRRQLVLVQTRNPQTFRIEAPRGKARNAVLKFIHDDFAEDRSAFQIHFGYDVNSQTIGGGESLRREMVQFVPANGLKETEIPIKFWKDEIPLNLTVSIYTIDVGPSWDMICQSNHTHHDITALNHWMGQSFTSTSKQRLNFVRFNFDACVMAVFGCALSRGQFYDPANVIAISDQIAFPGIAGYYSFNFPTRPFLEEAEIYNFTVMKPSVLNYPSNHGNPYPLGTVTDYNTAFGTSVTVARDSMFRVNVYSDVPELFNVRGILQASLASSMVPEVAIDKTIFTFGNANIAGGKLVLISPLGASYLRFNAFSDLTPLFERGTVRVKYTPHYNGGPAVNETIYSMTDPDLTARNFFGLAHNADDGLGHCYLRVAIGNSAAAYICNVLTYDWHPIADQEYEIELAFDCTIGRMWAYIDGIRIYDHTQLNWARTPTPIWFYLGTWARTPDAIANNPNQSYRDLQIFHEVLHTGPHYSTGYGTVVSSIHFDFEPFSG